MPTIPERMIRLEEKTDNIVAGQKAMVDQVAKLDEKVDKKFDELIGSLDRRYASKLSERIVYSVSGAILLAFVAAMIALVIPKKGPTVTNTITTNQRPSSGGSSSDPDTNNNSTTTTTTTQPDTTTSPLDGVKSLFGLK